MSLSPLLASWLTREFKDPKVSRSLPKISAGCLRRNFACLLSSLPIFIIFSKSLNGQEVRAAASCHGVSR